MTFVPLALADLLAYGSVPTLCCLWASPVLRNGAFSLPALAQAGETLFEKIIALFHRKRSLGSP